MAWQLKVHQHDVGCEAGCDLDGVGAVVGFAGQPLVLAGLALTAALAGTQVTRLGAGQAFGSNPLLFDGSLLPSVDGEREAIHIAHRSLALGLVLVVIVLAIGAWRRRRTGPARGDRPCLLAMGLVTMQVALGAANVVLESPPVVMAAHVGAAVWIWATAVALVVVDGERSWST